MKTNPFLEKTNFPKWSKLKSESIKTDITKALELAEFNLLVIRKTDLEKVTFANSVKALEQSTSDLNEAWGLVGHLDSVCNSKELRDAHNEMLPAVTEFFAKISLDADIWKVIKTFADTKEASDLSPIDRRLLEETIQDFKESGADLPEEKEHDSKSSQANLQKLLRNFQRMYWMLQMHGKWSFMRRKS